MSEATVDGYPRQVWWNADGETLVESYSITNMAHGTPLGIGDNDEKYGAQGAFQIEAGISSSYHIAHFFGLTEWIRRPKAATTPAFKAASRPAPKAPSKAPSKETAEVIPTTVTLGPGGPAVMPELSAVLWPHATLNRRPEPAGRSRRPAIDVGAVITRALTAAGLMK